MRPARTGRSSPLSPLDGLRLRERDCVFGIHERTEPWTPTRLLDRGMESSRSIARDPSGTLAGVVGSAIAISVIK